MKFMIVLAPALLVAFIGCNQSAASSSKSASSASSATRPQTVPDLILPLENSADLIVEHKEFALSANGENITVQTGVAWSENTIASSCTLVIEGLSADGSIASTYNLSDYIVRDHTTMVLAIQRAAGVVKGQATLNCKALAADSK